MIQLGFDVGGTNIKAGIVETREGEISIIAQRRIPFSKGQSYEAVVAAMEVLAKEMAEEIGRPFELIESIGVAIPGSIDKKKGIIIDAHNLGFHNVPLVEAMERKFPRKLIFLGNDADVAALAELHAGAFKGCNTAVLLTLGTGVGGGIILGGKMFTGGRGNGIEIGHMTLMHGGAKCSCGNRGCIETVCTATWLANQGKQVLKRKKDSLICKKAAGKIGRINAKTVIDAAKANDPVAMSIFNRYISYLSSAISSVADILDPEIIALGGGVSLAGEFLYEPLRQQVNKKTFFRCDYEIVPTMLGNDAGVIGAAMLIKNEKI